MSETRQSSLRHGDFGALQPRPPDATLPVGDSSLTACPRLASIQARVIDGFLSDVATAHDAPSVVILELGARSGQLAYRLIRRLAADDNLIAPPRSSFVHVLTARDDDTLDRWSADCQLQPLIERGWLDFARVDIDDLRPERPIVLRHAGLTLSPEHPADALVVLANDVFSHGPQDLFFIRRGQRYRCAPSAGPEVTYQLDPITDAAYEDPACDRILTDYADRLHEAAVTIPTRALSWMRRQRLLSRCGALLCADLGAVDGDLDGRPLPSELEARAPQLNLHAMIEYARRAGDVVLAPFRPGVCPTVVTFLHGHDDADWDATTSAYRDALADIDDLRDWRTLDPLVEGALPHASAEQLCTYVRLSDWSDHALTRCMPHLLARVQASDVSDGARWDIPRILEAVWSDHLRAPGQADLAFASGALLFGLGDYQRAASFFERSLALCGPSPAAHYNLALCAAQRGQHERALGHLDAALALKPDFPAARDARLRLMSAM